MLSWYVIKIFLLIRWQMQAKIRYWPFSQLAKTNSCQRLVSFRHDEFIDSKGNDVWINLMFADTHSSIIESWWEAKNPLYLPSPPNMCAVRVDSSPTVFQYLIHLHWSEVCATKKSLTLPLSLLYSKPHPAWNQSKIQTKPISKPNEASALDQAKTLFHTKPCPDALLTLPFYHIKPNIFCTPNQTLEPAKFFCFLFWTKLKLRSIPNHTRDAILTLPFYPCSVPIGLIFYRERAS